MDLNRLGPIRVICKAGRILELLKEREVVTVPEVVAELGDSRTTVIRICETLVSLGFLERSEGTRLGYKLGLGFLEYSSLVNERLSLRAVAMPVLREIADSLGDTAYLIKREADGGVCLGRVEGSFLVRAVLLREGGKLPYDAGAGSQVILAYMKTDEIQLTLSRFSEDKREILMERIRQIKRDGFYLSQNEYIDGTAAVGAPLFNDQGAVVGALSVGGIASRFEHSRLPSIVACILDGCEKVSRALGYRGAYPIFEDHSSHGE
ncbi:MAG: IclR family transcriptional regulator [Alicyclobacillus sp.]|nr:IclR family transcriptional regulator [Alicyclobacillus sp.]